jgi:hypothetical protein
MIAKFKAVKPNPINDVAMSKVLRDGAKEFSELTVDNREDITAPWKGEKPQWKVRYWANQYQIGFQVYPANEDSEGALKWLWLDLGTKGPYPIPKEGTANLAFPSIYNAGSRPGTIKTGASSSSGPTWFAKSVMHPGIKARGWSDILKKIEQPAFEKEMIPYMAQAAKVSGHGMEHK